MLQHRSRRTIRGVLATVALCALLPIGSAAAQAADAADAWAAEVFAATNVAGGVVVHVGATDGRRTAALRQNESLLVHGLARSAQDVDTARQFLRSEGLLGSVSVDQLTGKRLPYIDNLVNLLVSEDLGDVPIGEVLRVLVPGGVAYIKQGDGWKTTTKPRPADIDQWTHYLHDASGNAVAKDDVVGPPRHLQWVGSPRWSRHHDRMASLSAMVSAGGRVFYIMDEGSRVSIQLPPRWKLVARDAFNGTILWKRSLDSWHNHLWPLKSGPTQLARRLVATGDRVYVTLGFKAPLLALDARSGETLRTYENSDATEEIIAPEGVVMALVNDGESALDDYRPAHNVGDQRRVGQEFRWNEQPRRIVAYDPDSGAVLWSVESTVAPLTLSAAGGRVLFHDGEQVVCLDQASGSRIWETPAPRRPNVTMNFGPRLVLHEDVVLFAGGERTMRAFDLETGSELWSGSHAKSGYQSPEDVLVVNGLVWSGATTSGRDSGILTARDVRTGEVRVEFPPDVETYWFHHRCHMAKATEKFLLPSRTGIEFVDVDSNQWTINHWVRGGCLYGVMPCNGLVYAPPHNCACYPETKLYGLNALAPESANRQVVVEAAAGDERLERGPAFGEVSGSVAPADTPEGDWPTYRGDRQRSGRSATGVSTEISLTWQSFLGGRLSSPTVAAGQVFVAQIDEHTVHALDQSSGDVRWSYTVGGRVDSPPTFYRGTLLFGSADGWVYCLRASDGALAWRFRAAPADLRLIAYEQLESVWPVHGSVLVDHNIAYVVAGRSNFLDGGLRLYRLDPATGRMHSERVLDDRDPDSGQEMQSRVQVLNMPVGLPDILSSDGQYVYMRSQRFVDNGVREELGPHSGDPAEQGSTQHGAGVHLFAPMGFLDDTWFHRSYWVYGRSFAGGHAGYYQAGKYAPSGRILVFDDERVFGFGRKPQYYRWTTTLEHQLFATSKQPPVTSKMIRRGEAPHISFERTKSLDPSGKSIAVSAWIKRDTDAGVVVARGGPVRGYALIVRDGKPRFVARINEKIYVAGAKENIDKSWVHLVGALDAKDRKLRLYIDGELAAERKIPGPISQDPAQSLEIGFDAGGSVGDYPTSMAFKGLIDEVQVLHGTVTEADVKALRDATDAVDVSGAELVLSCGFDDGEAADASGNGNNGTLQGVAPVDGKFGRAMRFFGSRASSGSFVKHDWTQDLPIFVRAMVLADDTLLVCGPPDVMDEEETFARIMTGDPTVAPLLAQQDAALEGAAGGRLMAVSTKDGETLATYDVPAPPVWDGMAVTGGRVYLSTIAGDVICFGAK